MRTSLFHRVEPRRSPRSQRALPRLRRGPIRVRDESGKPAPAGEQSQPTAAQATGADAAVDRAQAAGGPVDQATYECGCGLLFNAPVSTTVRCPHCGAEQAW
jgi:hypothetical protein